MDLVINGHNHCYERTHPVRSGQPVAEVRPPRGGTWWAADGTTSLCAGGGGGRTFPMSPAPISTVTVARVTRLSEPAPRSAFRSNGLSLLLVDVTPPDRAGTTTMTVRAQSAAGGEIERFTRLRRHDGGPFLSPVPDQLGAGRVAA